MSLKKPLSTGRSEVLMEKPNMAFEGTLTAEETELYMPYKNTANYCVNIVEYVKQAFLKPGSTDKDVKRFLKEFYDARNDPEMKAKLRFERLETRYRIKKEFMYLEQSKNPLTDNYLMVGSLLGATLTWLADALFVAVPTVCKETLFEEQKYNVKDLERIPKDIKDIIMKIADINEQLLSKDELMSFLLNLRKKEKEGKAAEITLEEFNIVTANNAAIRSLNAEQMLQLINKIKEINQLTVERVMQKLFSQNDRRSLGMMNNAIEKINKEAGSIRIIDFLEQAEERYRIQYESQQLIQDKNDRYYPSLRPRRSSMSLPSRSARKGL